MNEEIAALGLLDDEAIILDAAALQLAALDHPDVDVDAYAEALGDITDRLAVVGADATRAVDRATALGLVFATELAFEGDRETYDHPDNADLIRVLDRRRGLPISLSLLYVAAARRLGWAADVLNTPGHVLVRIGAEAESLLIDPFNRGALVGPDQLARLLASVLGGDVRPAGEHLAPMSNRSALVRLLLNQATRAEAAGEPGRALTLFERITIIAPDNGHGWWERARLQLVDGDLGGARGSLSAMLEVTRDPQLRERVSAALDALAGPRR